MEHKIPILSFFSGGGFLDMGFEQAGFEVVWANEFDKTFAELHVAGMSSWRKSRGMDNKVEVLNTKSVTHLNNCEIISEAFPNGKPGVFGIVGGPPCQDFSMNGSLRGFDGERGKLTIVFFDKILQLKPSFFVMENVTGLTKRKETKEYLESFLQKVEDEYYVDHDKLNSLNYGVAQHRERVFFIGVRKDFISKNRIDVDLSKRWFPFPINEKYQNAAKKYRWGELDPFDNQPQKPEETPLELCVESCLIPTNELAIIPNAKEFFTLHKSVNELTKISEGETNRPSFKRLHRFRYSPTACYGNNEVHLHPYLNRRLSIREALRLQGVPDEYVLPPAVSLTKKFKMVGNGVPVPLAREVADAVMNFINDIQ